MFYQKAGTEMAAPAWNRRLGVAQGYSARDFRS
jgi:hypothetical protein